MREKFIAICTAIWGDEWQRPAAKHIGKSRRIVIYWANGTHEPKSWDDIFLSLLGACGPALAAIQKRQQSIIDFKRDYGRGRK